MGKLTVAIITFNEQKNIKRCLDSIVSIADEIIVVDSFSTDSTEEICSAYPNLVFIKNTFEGHIQQKNFALEQSTNHFVLSLDADECLNSSLQSKISDLKKDFVFQAYSFNRLTRYVDQWIKHCGWYPDKKIRLIDKRVARWGGVNPHDYIDLDPSIKVHHIAEDILHYSYDSISDHVNQTNKFTTIAAKTAFEKGKKSSFLTIVIRAYFKFFRDYILKLGFLDGRYGFVICYINSVYALLKYSKLKDLQEGKKID
ncbi:MAG: glycosyltransferase family 2 protein [Bdellovibrionales bacterium]